MEVGITGSLSEAGYCVISHSMMKNQVVKTKLLHILTAWFSIVLLGMGG